MLSKISVLDKIAKLLQPLLTLKQSKTNTKPTYKP